MGRIVEGMRPAGGMSIGEPHLVRTWCALLSNCNKHAQLPAHLNPMDGHTASQPHTWANEKLGGA